MARNRSPLWEISKQDLQNILDNSFSISDICRQLRIDAQNGSVRTLYKMLATYELDKSKFSKNCQERNKLTRIKDRISPDVLFTRNSKYPRKTIRTTVIRDKLIPYTCDYCNLRDIWCDRPLSL